MARYLPPHPANQSRLRTTLPTLPCSGVMLGLVRPPGPLDKMVSRRSGDVLAKRFLVETGARTQRRPTTPTNWVAKRQRVVAGAMAGAEGLAMLGDPRRRSRRVARQLLHFVKLVNDMLKGPRLPHDRKQKATWMRSLAAIAPWTSSIDDEGHDMTV